MRRYLVLACLLAFACGDDDTAPRDGDVFTVDGGDGRCGNDLDCSDGVFCNGAERCDRDAPGANERGCVAGSTPCSDGCDEVMNTCVSCDVPDADGDGFAAQACGGADCDDTDRDVNPDATEICDPEGFDEDCDPSTFGDRDDDDDGFVDARCCNLDRCGDDCDDGDDSVRPDSVEVCNRRDDDCDGSVDESVSVPGFVDEDSDGRGDGDRPAMACPGSPRFSTVGDDCDDDDPARNPAQVEVCDGVDNDCDDRADEQARAVPWYPDTDGDGFGDASATPTTSCGRPEGHVLNAFDCDDTRSTVSPRAAEQCNGRDDDCDGVAVFEGVLEDRDGDRIPDARCGGDVVDCDDGSIRVGPGALELCNGADDDCDGRIDEAATAVMWYLDEDRDGYGSEVGISSCAPPGNYVLVGGDCEPRNFYAHPNMAERCDGADQDCDGRIDEQQAIAECAASDRVCRGGLCIATDCPSGQSLCDVTGGTACIDTAVNADHCGGCDRQCPSGQLCQDSTCIGWDEVELGQYPNCARAGGRVYCWGRETGSGVMAPPGGFARPQTVVGIDDATTIEAGGAHACVLRTGGEAWCFGLNNYGQLGDNTTMPRLAPVRVSTALRFNEIATGGDATCGRVIGAGPVVEDTVYCWGSNDTGVARPSLVGTVLRPERLQDGFGAARLDVGSDHACAVSGISLWCWGTNTYGQLGPVGAGTDNFYEPREVFVGVPSSTEVTNIATGDGHTCFVTNGLGASEGGVVRCLGRYDSGQAGGTPGSCGACSGEQYCLDGTCVGGGVDCMPGCDANSYCVRGTCLPYVTTPRQVYLPDGVTPLDGVVDLDAGDRHTCAIRFDGTVWCWGANGSAELAQDSALMVNSQVARQVMARWTGDAYQLTVGGTHACIRADGGTLWCWGSNISNENGTGVPYTIVARPLLAPVR
ncbi:MAG: hypothetical protein H6724_02270 [Sandaracinus sp.]|nr:hypothetical protein [Sandaracinus sp.]